MRMRTTSAAVDSILVAYFDSVLCDGFANPRVDWSCKSCLDITVRRGTPYDVSSRRSCERLWAPSEPYLEKGGIVQMA